jgi:hypothetical protein
MFNCDFIVVLLELHTIERRSLVIAPLLSNRDLYNLYMMTPQLFSKT